MHPTESMILEGVANYGLVVANVWTPHPPCEELCMHVGIAYSKCDIGFSLVDWQISGVVNNQVRARQKATEV